ncbi:predicted protein [Chaetomium globosum CBS 148.51]|uniref:Uncharacterized protein n=1 Tax=Chaetomium globosum (strain ATCC 6205 / CBS 148.51 / DSM 1962 / NBRC 6347 / NRRL 1970) TaxID=306901 RepID=Q2GQV7_CHAGB|nr:uncharacterized protein CHGG_09647 [Chaetomium globosum CBS 148.51]EAQ83243.1 predicted protein [Chaetomium globosum CBS 148.51]
MGCVGYTTAGPTQIPYSAEAVTGDGPWISSYNSSFEPSGSRRGHPRLSPTLNRYFGLRPFTSIMDVDCGFDIFPRLDAADEADRPAYQQFLGEIIDTYKDPHGEKGSWEERKVLQLPAGDSGGYFGDRVRW